MPKERKEVTFSLTECTHVPNRRPGIVFTTFSPILEEIGGFGRYQFTLFVTVLYSTVVWLSATLFTDFGLIQPEYKCSSAPTNASVCQFWYTCENVTVVSTQFYSVVQEYKLNCKDKCGTIRIIKVYMDLAGGFGSIIGGHIGDNLGRKKYLFGAQVLLCVSSVMTTACRSWQCFATMQGLSNFLEQMAFILACVMVMEITDLQHRLLASLCSRYFFAYTVAAMIGYFTRDWRRYLIMCNFITAPLLLFYVLLHESPRYAINRGHFKQGANILNDIAYRWNHKDVTHFTPSLLSTVERPMNKRFHSVIDLFRNATFTKVSIMQLLACAALGIYLHAFDTNSDFFSKVGPFKGATLYGSIQFGIPLIILFMERYIPRFGRKTMFNLALLVMIFCYGTILVRHRYEVDHVYSNWADLGLSIVGYTTATSGYFISIVLFTVEFFPTYIRATALGTFFSVQRFASAVLASHCNPREGYFERFPYYLAIGVALLTLIVGYFLQIETRGVRLPDTLEQALISPASLLINEHTAAVTTWRKVTMEKVLHPRRKSIIDPAERRRKMSLDPNTRF